MSEFTHKIDDVRRLELRNIVGTNLVHRATAADWTGVEAAAAMAADLGFVGYDGDVINGLDHFIAESIGSEHTNYLPIVNLLETAGRARMGEGFSTADLKIHLDVEVRESDIADGVQGNCSLCAFGLALQRAVGDDNHVHVMGTMAFLNAWHHCWLPNEVRTFIDLFDRNPDTGDFVKPFRTHLVFLATGRAIIPPVCREWSGKFHNDAEPLWSYWIETDEGVRSGEIRAKTLQFARGVLTSAFPEDKGADGELTSPDNNTFPIWRE